jgi:hypothetical protein
MEYELIFGIKRVKWTGGSMVLWSGLQNGLEAVWFCGAACKRVKWTGGSMVLWSGLQKG